MDFALANAAGAPGVSAQVLVDEPDKPLAALLAARWKKPSVPVHVLEAGLRDLSRRLAADSCEYVVLSSLSSICVFDPRALLDALPAGADLVKLSFQDTPVETYVARRERVVEILEARVARARPGGRSREYLFRDTLFSAIDLIQDVPGEMLFQNDLTEYYKANIWAISNCEGARYNRILSRLPPRAEPGRESRVAEKATVRDSILGPGVEVEGTVEGSILFPDVTVQRGAVVSGCVILTGNRIGSGAVLQNTLVLPYHTDAPRTGPNIGDRCQLGARSSTARNADFPSQVRDGMVLVGMNAEIPSGFKAEAATVVGPGVPASALRRLKTLRRGASILEGQG